MTTLLEAARAGRQELRILLCHDTPKCMKCVPLHASIVKLDAANMVRADALFSAASQAVSAHTAEIDAYETHRAEVLRRLNQ